MLAKHDDVSSTERLLDLIRSDNNSDYIAGGIDRQKSLGHRLKNIFHNPMSIGKTVTVGVDLGHDDLKLAMIGRVSDQKYELLAYDRIPFEANLDRHDPQFPQFIRTVLTDFCRHAKNVELWCTIPSARVETHLIRIPKVNPKQIPTSVYWSYKKISAFDESQYVFDFDIIAEAEEDDRPKFDVIAYTAPRKVIKQLKGTFSKAGYPLLGISTVPFAFQTLVRTGRIDTDETHIASLYIGRDWSRIDLFSDGNLVLSRGIKAGVKTMIAALREQIEGRILEHSVARSPSEDSARIQAIRKRLKKELVQARHLFFGDIHEKVPSALDERQRRLIEDRIFSMILPALERLVRQVERTLQHFSLNHANARVEKLFISSGVDPHRRIVDYIAEELSISTETLNPFADSANFLSLAPTPEDASEQSAYVPAMGMALSSNKLTPNFLHTYKDKQKAARTQWVNRGLIAAFGLVMLLCVGVSFLQGREVEAKERQLRLLQRQLDNFALQVDKKLILKLVDQARSNHRRIRKIGQKYVGLAVISEISQLTPPSVRLFNISAKLGGVPVDKKGRKKNKKKVVPNKAVILEGIVSGDRLIQEAILAGYLMELKNSPMFGQPRISKKAFERYKNRDVLRFTARINLL